MLTVLPLHAEQAPNAGPAPEGPSTTLPEVPVDPSFGAIPDGRPKTAEEKAHILSDLYERLSHSKSEAAAGLIEEAVQRLWLYSGSDTVDLLVSRAGDVMQGEQADRGLALQLLDAAIALKPDYPEAWDQRAYIFFSQEKYELAMGDLRRVLSLDPRHYKAMTGVGAILQEFGNKKAALAMYRRALAVNPFSEEAKKAVETLERDVEGQAI